MTYIKRLKYITLVCSLLLTVYGNASVGTVQLPDEAQSESGEPKSETIDTKHIENLINTLENDAERQQLIDNLRVLIQENKNIKKDEFDIREILKIDEQNQTFTAEVNQLLNKLNIKESIGWNLLIYVAFLMGILILYILNQWIIRVVRKRQSMLNNRIDLPKKRFHLLFKIETTFVAVILLYLALYLLAVIVFKQSPKSIRELGVSNISGYIYTTFTILFVFALIWEGANATIEFIIGRRKLNNNPRIITLLPIVRNILLFTLSLLVALILLSEIGIDIYPLLAGAGVLGIAVGLGAQTLIKDFITGFMVIFEDLLQIGDIVSVGGRTGQVEGISMRKLQLRDLNGTVHTVPFGEVSIVDNLTKDFSYYLMDIGVAYRENVDEVIDLLRELGKELRESDDFGSDILDDLEILGVDRFADSAVMIKARIKTTPIKQWRVGREFNRRMKHCFDKNNIEIPFPHQTVYFGEDKKGESPAANLRVYKKDAFEGIEEVEAEGDNRLGDEKQGQPDKD